MLYNSSFMKQNVLVLDFDGLVSYPGFGDRVLKPLIEQRRPFWFWTYNHRENVKPVLVRMGFPDLAQDRRIIDQEIFASWDSRIQRIIDRHGLIDEREKKSERWILGKILEISGIQADEDGLKRFIEKFQDYDAVAAQPYKYPPLLGDDNYLLVESDSAGYSSISRDLWRPNPQGQIELARRGLHSLVLVPEHPEVWGEDVPTVPFSPEDITDELVPLILSWNGEHIIRDLSVERGLFEVEAPHFQERATRRHPEG